MHRSTTDRGIPNRWTPEVAVERLEATMASPRPVHEGGAVENAVRKYAEGLLHAPVTALTEIGNGNINRVFRARAGNETVIVKYAPPFVSKFGAGSPLSSSRIVIEASAYRLHRKVVPELLPMLRSHSRNHSMLALEDLGGMEDWRSQLLTGDPDPAIAELAGVYLGRIGICTGALSLPTQQANRLRNRFANTIMQRFTEREVFVTPYRAHQIAAWPEGFADIANRVRRDEAARSQTKDAWWLYRTSVEAVLHGDLHTGSVMVGSGKPPRIIDLEFAFPGPIAFDAGTFLAHLFLARARRCALGTAVEAVDESAAEFWRAFLASMRASAGASIDEGFVHRLLDQTRIFAATELLRRVGGRFPIEDISSLALSAQSIAYHRVIDTWAALIEARGVLSFAQLWDLSANPRKEYR